MAKIIGVIQVEGGSGRSTVSTNLARELLKQGKTALIDSDTPQGAIFLSNWCSPWFLLMV